MATTLIREYREAQGLSQEALAFDVQISVSQLSRYETDLRDPRLSDLRRIAKRLNVGVPTLIGESTAVSVPLLTWVSAGQMAQAETVQSGQISRYLHITDLPHGDWIALQVEGDSMDRVAPHGSYIFVNRGDTKLVQAKFYVIGTDEGEATFKRYRARPDRLQPFSTNPDHETLFLTGGETVIGRVHRVMHDLP